MIQTGIESRVKIQDIISNQLPEFVLDESPKTVDFLKQYYISQEYQGGPVDISDNLDQYLRVDNLVPEVIVDSTKLSSDIDSSSTVINVSSTKGFPNQYGLLKIDNEIITYTGITTNSFTGCVRGFSGISEYNQDSADEDLIFSTSTAAEHKSNSSIQNLSSLFLKEFYKKFKSTFTPGLEEIPFSDQIDAGNFIKRAKDFYSSKGTDEAIKILFRVIFGETPSIVNLEDYLIKPSSANYVRREVGIVEVVSGEPLKIVGQSLIKTTDESTMASISSVEPFTRKGKTFYKIGLYVSNDGRSSVEGNFEITPNTKIIGHALPGETILSVDSTVSFPESGTLISGTNTISYTGKSINQFFGCTGITSKITSTSNIRSRDTYFSYEKGDTTKKVEVILLGVIDNLKEDTDQFKSSPGDIITVKSLGDKIKNNNSNWKEIFANSFIYNTSASYEIVGDATGTIILGSPIDRSSLKIGDEVEITVRETGEAVPSSNVTYISAINVASNSLTLVNKPTLVSSGRYNVRRKLNKTNSSGSGFGENSLLSDILNLYVDGDEYAYVASNSLPSKVTNSNNYRLDVQVDIESTTISSLANLKDLQNDVYNIFEVSSVPFMTGDQVFYSPQEEPLVGLSTGTYFVEKLSNTQFKLYGSGSLIGSTSNITFQVPASGIGTHTFTLNAQKDAELGIQKLLRKFPLEKNIRDGSAELTVPGTTGMLINGVEISNYKSPDAIYYGPIESTKILSGGTDFDVINPPRMEISSGSAKLQPVISGKIEKIYIDSQNYNIDKISSIDVRGGNGKGAVIEPVLISRPREVLFNADEFVDGGGVNASTNQIACLTDHNFINGQQVTYNSLGNTPVAIGTFGYNFGIPDNSTYFVEVTNNKTIRLYYTLSDQQAGVNPVGIYTGSSGSHKFSTVSTEKQVENIKVINPGEGFTNRKLIVKSAGISTVQDTITFKNHGFNDGEIVRYNYETTEISGISSANQYHILKIDNDSFRLANAGVGGTITSNYERGEYEKLNSTGTGYQYFEYPEISVSIKYSTVGFGTTTQSYQELIVTPVVKGEIIDAYVYESGTGYGSTILNTQVSPPVSIKNGTGAELTPIVVGGRITNVAISYEGTEYYSVPELVVSGSGTGAELRAIIDNGRISEVKVLNTGIGYSASNTSIEIVTSGRSAIVEPQVRKLTVNDNNARFTTGEVLRKGADKLQYSVSKYFETLRDSFSEDGTLSGIIGWAYDGNPIYGPTAYSDPNNIFSTLKTIESGYTLDISNVTDRPSGFSDGFFVEDYKFDGSGDLDEYNGRYEKNDEYPNGVYAYHATLDEFPYFIGNKYKSKLVFDANLNQSFDFNNSNLLRNTLPYKVTEKAADYDFFNETSDVLDQKIEVVSTTSGSIESLEIKNAGSNYKVGDRLTFDNTNTLGSGLDADVKSIKGKTITNVNATSISHPDSIFTWNSSKDVKVSILPEHNLLNLDYVTISGFSTNLSSLNGVHKIKVPSYPEGRCLTEIKANLGVTTEIYVAPIPPQVSVGSSIGIGTETLEVLGTFKNDNIIRIKRGNPASSHAVGTAVSFLPDSFTIEQSVDKFDSRVNEKVYFNPKESVGVSTENGVGYSTSFIFGTIEVTRSIPSKSITVDNHPFVTNQPIVYSANGANIQVSTDGLSSSAIDLPTNLFVINKNPNLIGLKTAINGDELFFHSNGVDNDLYSFTSNHTQILGDVEKNEINVSVSTAHELRVGDVVTLNIEPNLSVGIGTSSPVSVLYNSQIGNIVVDPIGFNSTGINTATGNITIPDHGLKTGDKVLYTDADSTEYFVYRINKDRINLCKTHFDSQQNPPTTVSFASTGTASQSISLINPELNPIANNNIVFDLSDSSLTGYEFKIYTDSQFKNEFVSSGSTSSFNISRSANQLTINYDSNLPKQLYYTLEKEGVVTKSDTEVKNYSSIQYEESIYNDTYEVTGADTTSFSVNAVRKPERSSYISTECDTLEYSTTSAFASGPVSSLRVLSFGSGYQELPTLKSTNSVSGIDLVVNPASNAIGHLNEIEVLNNKFTYGSDKTLRPKANVSPTIVLKDSNTIDQLLIVNNGKGYSSPPTLTLVDSTTRNVIDSGLLKAELTGTSISLVEIQSEPKGLPDETVEVFATNNTNGVAIVNVESSNSGIFTCAISTPGIGTLASFSVQPFVNGDEVFIEGIQKLSTSGGGFNSKDYGYKFFKVTNYDNSGLYDTVTLSAAGLTTNTGIAKTVQDYSGILINKKDYPEFEVIQKITPFFIGESLSTNGVVRDLTVAKNVGNTLKVSGLYELSLGEIITGTQSGNTATITSLSANEATFDVDYSNLQKIGWDTEVGKLSEDYQVIPNNDYYQNLSYSVKSSKTYLEQQSPVENLVHTSGLKNFADTGITSSTSAGLKNTIDGVTIIMGFVDEKRVDTIKNFDTVVDQDVIGSTSKFIKLENKRLTNFSELRGLNVLKVDDISNQFSNSESETTEYLNIQEVDDAEYHNYLFKVTSEDNSEIQLTDLTIMSDTFETVIVENESISNSNSPYGTFDLYTNEFNETILRFSPVDPFNTNYDVKLIKQVFNTSMSGVGTQSVGFVDLTGSVDIETGAVGLGSTTIISLDASNFESVYVNAQVIDDDTKDMNYVKLYITHDGTNTYMSEYYIDNTFAASTGNQIGTFYSELNNGVLSITHSNLSPNTIKVRSNVVGFGTTTSGVGTYRFKAPSQANGQERSALYDSSFQSMVGIASTTIQTLNRTLFDASKSLVQVSMGSSKALHQVLMVSDGTDVYTQQSPFLSVDTTNNTFDTLSGIGTFGGEISGSNIILKFYPDDTTKTIDIEVFSKVLYSEIDFSNDYNDLTYGTITESVDEKLYNAINGERINKTNFRLAENTIPIFSKVFNPADSAALEASTGTFTLPNHFFSDGEELIYTPNSTVVGVGTSAMMINATTVLPSKVYAIKLTEDTFNVSTTKNGSAVTFTSLGEGNAHRLTMKERNSKCIVNLDGLIQYPIAFAGVTHTLSGNLGIVTTYINLSGISSINPQDILKIDDEYMGVTNIGYGETTDGPITHSGGYKLVEVERGFVGSSPATHTNSTSVTLHKGAFDIVDDEIHFAEPPRGNPQIDKTASNLDFPTTTFSARVFLKSNYDNNKVYDDISNNFSGIGRTFNLTVGGANTAGIGTEGSNGLVFVNNIYQSPKTDNNPTRSNYVILDDSTAGISTVSFTGITRPDDPLQYVVSDYDINQNETPRGGIIVSYGSSAGLGFAPLVGASVTAVVGAGGSIVSVGLGTTDNLGSGYNGLVSIGVSVVDIEYDHKFVSAGVNSITDNTGGTHTATDATYNSRTGDLVLTIANHGLTTANTIGIATESLVFTCSKDSHTTNHSYPREVSKTKQRRGQSGGDPIYNQQVAIAATTPNTIQIGVGSGGGAGTGAVVSVASIGIGGTLSFNVGSAGTNYVNPEIFVADPSYENLPITGVYREGIGNTTTTGVGLLMDIIVGGSSTTGIGSTYFEVKEFKFSRPGYSFQRGDRFKPVGLVTDAALASPLADFEINVIDTYTDNFAAWEFGELDYIDSIENLQDGARKRFPLNYNGELLSFEPLEGSPVEKNINNVLIIFVNGVLQDPVKNFIFQGGTSFVFTKAPLKEDEVEIYFYKGVDGVDSSSNDNQSPSIKTGDNVRVISNNTILNTITQDPRTVYNLSFSDKFETNRYFDQGIDETNFKPINWTKQKSDRVINGEFVSKSRDMLESLIFPTARIIDDVSTTDTEIFVDNAELFSYESDNNYTDPSVPFDALVINGISTVGFATGLVEKIIGFSQFEGFSGVITSIAPTTGTSGNPKAIQFTIVDDTTPTGFVGMTTGYPIYITNTQVGAGVTSINSSNTEIVGIGTTTLDNVYRVSAWEYSELVAGVYVGIFTCNVDSNSNLAGIGITGDILNPVGQYSWGRLYGATGRSSNPISIGVTGNVVSGLSTYPTIQRRGGTNIRKTGALPKIES